MGFFSFLLNTPPSPSRSDLALLVKYSYLLESLGMDAIFDCVDESMLPADKDQLRTIIAKVSLHKRKTRVLYGTDLPTAYGALAFFLPQDELNLVRKAQEFGENPRPGVPTPLEVEKSMEVFMKAHNRGLVAEEELAKHAATIRRGEKNGADDSQ